MAYYVVIKDGNKFQITRKPMTKLQAQKFAKRLRKSEKGTTFKVSVRKF